MKRSVTESGFFRVIAGHEHEVAFKEAIKAVQDGLRTDISVWLLERKETLRLGDLSDEQIETIASGVANLARNKAGNLALVVIELTRPDKGERPATCPHCFRSTAPKAGWQPT